MPDFRSYSKKDLEYALQSLCFKPIKSQQLMIETLEKCWQDKRRLVLESVDSNKQRPRKETKKDGKVEKSPSKNGKSQEQDVSAGKCDHAELPRRKRGGPRKSTEASSEVAPQAARKPTKGQRSKAQSANAAEASASIVPEEHYAIAKASTTDVPLLDILPTQSPLETSLTTTERAGQATLSTKEAKITPAAATDEKQAYLLQKITEAIDKEPPTHDATRPSWHEKILMYDPIILEDLAQWLNVTGLGTVGCDDEVWPGLVREWCAARSITCVWRMSLRGVARSRL